MLIADKTQLEEHGRVWARRLLWKEALAEKERVAAEYRRMKWTYRDIVSGLYYYFNATKKAIRKVEKEYFAATTVDTRIKLAKLHEEHRSEARELKSAIAESETELATVATRYQNAERQFQVAQQRYLEALGQFIDNGMAMAQSIPSVAVFCKAFSKDRADFKMDDSGVAHVFCRRKGDPWTKKGHLALLPNGNVKYCRPPGVPHGGHNFLKQGLPRTKGVSVLHGRLTPFLNLSVSILQ